VVELTRIVAYFCVSKFYTSVGGMKRSGMRGCEPIPRYRPYQRATMLRIPLKPLCFMTACYQLAFLFLSYYQSNITNLFNRSTAISRCVGAGWADKLFGKIRIAGWVCVFCQCA